MSRLPARAQLFVVGVSSAGLAVLVECIYSVLIEPIKTEWLILAGLTLLTGSFTIKIPAITARISVSETFVFASVLLFGPCAGTVIATLDILISSLPFRNPRQPERVLFNISSTAISIWLAGHAFYLLYGQPPLTEVSARLPQFVAPLVVLAILYFVSNSGLVAIAIALERGGNAFLIWRRNFLWISVSYFGGASVAGLLLSYTQTVDLFALGIIVPLLVISYLTFKTSLGRIDDAMKHVEEVDKLYLSTIETLATAIDAKDQVTSGHIRRVQKFTLGLASELGIKDERQLKAIEAAALLHDTGKLVVPEHILNKPGRLTSGEFDKMKRHASAGAEILASISFPYPVVPIVRHHHEFWDGNGYPDGLRGTEIPIGARILSVVDCFDALTSDRPYRRRLSDAEAMQILLQRRGTMYDPLVVDTFVAVKDKLAGSLETEASPEAVARERSWRRDVQEVSELAEALTANGPAQQLVHLLLKSLVDATSARIATLFITDTRTDELHSVAARSQESAVALQVVMPVGSRVTGWVAANGSPIINADAALDLPDDAQRLGLLKCLCVPVRYNSDVLGVASVYLDDPRGFSERDLIVVDAAVKAVDLRPLVDFLTNLSNRGIQASKHGPKRPPTVH